MFREFSARLSENKKKETKGGEKHREGRGEKKHQHAAASSSAPTRLLVPHAQTKCDSQANALTRYTKRSLYSVHPALFHFRHVSEPLAGLFFCRSKNLLYAAAMTYFAPITSPSVLVTISKDSLKRRPR